MPDIKENIKQAILEKLAEEENNLEERRIYAIQDQEFYQIRCEENFISKLRKLVESI